MPRQNKHLTDTLVQYAQSATFIFKLYLFCQFFSLTLLQKSASNFYREIIDFQIWFGTSP